MLETSACTTGPLNQYTAIGRGEEASFEPVYDADGNQTLIRTSTGIWQVTYNAENRPVRFVNESAKTVVECTYDYMGRQHTRKVSVNGTVSSYLRYMYRGYLQIATSPSPSSGAANTARKNWGLSTTTTGISIRLTESEAFTTYEVPIMTFLLLMKTSDKVFFNEEVLCNMQ